MAIKSYTGRRVKEIPKETRLKVSDYMTRNLITFSPEQPVEEVIEALLKYRISGGPVVNDKNELIGMISEGDCIKHISDSRYYNMPMAERKVGLRMIKNVETIDGNMNIFDAAKKFLEVRRRRFPIVENGKLVGQISQKDILKATMSLKSEHWK
ncbi:CBS domain-containing protein [Flagellimonas zhangzhouensis]|uniref:CBS domain-containing protein n=1 Tax=Flagellimonas zhangzhouensis TaxID=1073328 RepID=A0A1H2WXI1_9FLAO|nr:CBS domain-containing protein [Allomuricauda zhangzhouensis]SDQ25750.1 CBS domain-containing protein [Allomuricauda zhangzhouensis]SDW85216.1 CBS domain-containing protein [Allomuricauda zhangzhouensis]